jgi:hypothetical protein
MVKANIAKYNRDTNSDNATRCEAANMDANGVVKQYANGEKISDCKI